MNLAQKIAIAVTGLAVAVFLFAGGQHVAYPDAFTRFTGIGWYTDWGATFADCAGILLVGGVATWLLGVRRKRVKDEQKPES
jgi:hypothetical protein